MYFKTLVSLACVAAVAGFGGCSVTDSADDAESRSLPSALSSAKSDGPRDEDRSTQPPGSSSPKPGIGVEVFEVEPRSLTSEVATTGELMANEEVELRSEEDGRVVSILFAEGQNVASGDLLVKINDADLQAELRRAQVQKRLAQQREVRVRNLLDENTVSQQVYDEARGQLEIVDAQLESLRARIAKTEIRAPFSGVVGLRSVSEGSYLTSSNRIATLQNLDPIKLDFAVPEKYAGQVDRGDEVDFTVAGLDRTFRGKVYAVEPRVDAATRTVQVRARAANPDGRLMPGAFAEVQLVLAEREDALMVPAIALIPGLDTTTVYVVEDGKAASRPVRTGQRTEGKVEITEGLVAGDRVIVSGIQQVRPGAEVAPR
ncbi:MAG: efflux RND transporter periplasmic adaptor subunit [Acidobacteriota bacterium]